MGSKISKNTWKKIRTCLQVAILSAVALTVVWKFTERGEPPYFDRKNWTVRDGFVAISYGAVARENTSDLNSRQQLAEHIAALIAAGYNWITTNDIIKFYQNGDPLPDNAIFLMFEGGRKDSVIFGQDIIGPAGAHATLFTNTDTLSSWNNFFVTFTNVTALSKSPFWDVGSQGRRLLRINENIPGVAPNYFLNDYLRDTKGEKKENDAEMKARLADFYEKSFAPLSLSMQSPPQAYIFMPANSFNSLMPDEVEEANRQLMARYFPIAFTREGAPFNSAADNPHDLTRLQVPSSWDAATLLEVLAQLHTSRDFFTLKSEESAKEWASPRAQVDTTDSALLLTPQQGSTDPALLRGTRHWSNARLSLTLDKEDQGERHIYLRYTSRGAYIRLTVRHNRLSLVERLPGQGLFTVFDSVLPKPPPWNLDIQLIGNRLGISLDGDLLESGLLPLSSLLRNGSVGLGATLDAGQTAKFQKFRAERLPHIWKIENAAGQYAVKGLNGVLREPKGAKDEASQSPTVTAVILPLAEGTSSFQEKNMLLSRQIMNARNHGSLTVAALPVGQIDFNEGALTLLPFDKKSSLKLWDGAVLAPTPQSNWEEVRINLKKIKDTSLLAVLHLSREAADALIQSGEQMEADYYILDFHQKDMPADLWTKLAHRHNRNMFLQPLKTPQGGDGLYSARSN